MSAVHLAEGAEVSLSGGNTTLVVIVAVIAIVALAMAALFRQEVLAAPEGTENMRSIGQAVQEGAQAYLTRQFKTLAVFAAVAFVLLFVLPGDAEVRIGRSLFFLLGAGFSAAIGYMGMSLAVKANVRVAAAAQDEGRDPAMRVAFRTGGAVGMATVGLGLLGAAAVVLIYRTDAPSVLEGFGFGAALLAMFMRVGGGIFTKAADVGADLVGKVEQNIPEDDPRNAATIADNVGDNVGDCAGMAADLFESYAVTLVAALILGKVAFGAEGLVFPLIVPAIGAITAIIGVYITRPNPNEGGLVTINRAFYISAAISAVLCAIAAFTYLPSSFDDLTDASGGVDVIGGILRHQQLRRRGRPAGHRAGRGPDRYRAGRGHPGAHRLLHRHRAPSGQGRRQDLAHRRGDGDPVRPVGRLRVCRLHRAGDRQRRLRCVPARLGHDHRLAVRGRPGRLRPADHGRRHRGDGHLRPGLRQRPGHRRDVRRRRRGGRGDPDRARRGRQHHQGDHQGHRDRHGGARRDRAVRRLHRRGRRRDPGAERRLERHQHHRGPEPAAASSTSSTRPTWSGLLLGAAVVFLFSGLAINAVGRAAGAVVFEVRRQFREIPGIMEGTGRPEYGKVVDICTRDSLRELATPGLLAIMAPIAVGFGLGVGPLAGFLAGAIGTGTLMAVFLANSGGAWDNAKKLVEDGVHGGKGSPAHEATIIGDTVGDPFKDTAGPAINPLLKVMNLVSLLVAAAIVKMSYGDDANDCAPVSRSRSRRP